MVLLERLRNKGAIFVGIAIGVAMLAFILTDFLTSGRSLFGGSDMVVGSVNGHSMDYMEFLHRVEYRRNLQQAMMGGQPLDERASEYIREQIWQEFIREEVLKKECAKVGLEVTSEELSSVILGAEPHPIVKQLFSNPETQEFDREQMMLFLQNLESPDVSATHREYWIQIENELQNELLLKKFRALVGKSLYYTSFDKKMREEEGKKKVDVAYVMKSYNSIPDSVVEVTEDDARTYYAEHYNSYKRPESRDIAYVVFDIKPQAMDYEVAEKWIKDYHDEFALTKDPGKFATENGDQPYTGAWNTREDLPKGIADWVFDEAEVGQTSEIIADADRFYMVRLIGRKTLPDSAHARHILFSSQHYPLERAEFLADSLKQLLEHGADFAALAEKYSDDPGSKSRGGDLDWFAQGTMVKPFSDACFEGKKGDLVKVNSNFGVHLIEVLGHRGESKRADVAIFSRNVEPGSETFQRYFNEASAFAANAHQSRPSWIRRIFGAGKHRVEEVETNFDSLVNKSQLNKRLANDLDLNSNRIDQVDDARQLVRWAFDAHLGDVSSVFQMGNHFAVAMLLRIKESENGHAVFDAVKESAYNGALRDKKAKMLSDEFAALQGKNLEAIASAKGESVRRASDVLFSSYAFGREGFEPAVIGATSALEQGKISHPVEGNAGIYLLQVEASTDNEENAPSNLGAEQNMGRSRISYEAYEALKQMCEIEDLRGKFF